MAHKVSLFLLAWESATSQKHAQAAGLAKDKKALAACKPFQEPFQAVVVEVESNSEVDSWTATSSVGFSAVSDGRDLRVCAASVC